MPRIELAQIWMEHPPAPPILRDCSFTIDAGERVALLGPSGSGKTTVLRLIAGLETPTKGALLLDGRPDSARCGPSREIGLVFQQPVLYPMLSVEDNLAIGWRLRYNAFVSSSREREPSSLRPRLDQVAELLELGPLLKRRPDALSGGERQRTALGRALVSRSAVFLLDEPLACLDPPLAERILARLVPLFADWNSTVLWVTHRREEAERLKARVLVLEAGQVRQP